MLATVVSLYGKISNPRRLFLRGLIQTKLFELALSSCFRLLLALNAGFVVLFSLLNFGKNTGTLTLSLESAKCAVKCFVFFNSDFCHLISLPPITEVILSFKLLYIIHDKNRLVKGVVKLF